MADPLTDGAGQIPPELLQILQPLMDVVEPILSTLSWMIGGIFGIYLLWLVTKIYFDNKRVKLLKEIRDDIKFLREQAESKQNKSKKKRKKK